MTQKEKIIPERGIAVALSMLMVLSVVAIGATAITPAAAQTADDADRTISQTTVSAGDTVEVTVDVSLDEAQSFQIDEGFDPAFANTEIVDSDGADFEANESDRVVTRYGVLGGEERQDVTVTYEVEIPDTAEPGDTFAISSNDDSDVQLGTDEITVTTDVDASRTLSQDQVQPGDTVEVTVDVSLDEAQSFQIDEGFDPAFANTEIVDSDGADFEANESDRVVTRYGVLGGEERQDVTVTYEVEIPDTAEPGDTFAISSNDDSDVQLGTDQIEVIEEVEASVSIDDQTYFGSTGAVDVANAEANVDYVIAIHEGDVDGDDNLNFDIRGVSDPFNAGETAQDVTIDVSPVFSQSQEITAMLHEVDESADNNLGPALDVEGFTDTASLTIETTDGARTAEAVELSPGESTNVTLDVELDEARDLFIQESFDPAFANVEVVDADGADFAQANAENNEVVASYRDRQSVSLVYEVTVPDDAEQQTFTLSSGAESAVLADDVMIDVVEDLEPVDGARTAEAVALAPGESTNVTLDVELDEARDLFIQESFDPAFANVEVVDADGADFAQANAENNEVVASYRDRQSVSLVYEVTVPDDAEQQNFTLSSGAESDVLADDVMIELNPLFNYTNDEGIIDTDGLRLAISDWRNEELTTDQLREVIRTWRSEEPIE